MVRSTTPTGTMQFRVSSVDRLNSFPSHTQSTDSSRIYLFRSRKTTARNFPFALEELLEVDSVHCLNRKRPTQTVTCLSVSTKCHHWEERSLIADSRNAWAT